MILNWVLTAPKSQKFVHKRAFKISALGSSERTHGAASSLCWVTSLADFLLSRAFSALWFSPDVVSHVPANSPHNLVGPWGRWLVLLHPKIQAGNACAEMHALMAPSLVLSSSWQPTLCQDVRITQSSPLLACSLWTGLAQQSIYCRNGSFFW